LGGRLLPPDEGLVLAAAKIKASWPMAYADAFAVATAASTGTTLLTGDPELLAPHRTWLAHDLRP
jgi:ribonuclease VapC